MEALRRHGWFVLAALAALTAGVMTQGAQSAYALLPALVAGLFVCAGLLARDLRRGSALTALYGLGCALYLYRQKLDTSGAKAICSIDSYLDCDRINDSVYSEAFGVPIAAFGAAYYAGLALAAWLRPADEAKAPAFHQLNALLGLVGVAYSLFLAWASVQVGALCIVCTTMYGVNVLLLAAGLVGLRRAGRGLFDGVGSMFAGPDVRNFALGSLIALVALIQGSSGATPGKAPPKADGGGPDWSALYTAAGEVALDGKEPVTGSRDPRYEVVEFADFGCPHCARAKKELDELVALRRDVSVRFKPFALSGKCNPTLEDVGVGQERCDAARAAICAGRQERFWAMADLLFVNQGYFAPDQLEQMAAQAGLDTDAWKTCMQDPTSLDDVAAAGAAGGALGIRGTPALFVRGLFGTRWVEITQGVPAVLELIEAAERGEKLPAP